MDSGQGLWRQSRVQAGRECTTVWEAMQIPSRVITLMSREGKYVCLYQHRSPELKRPGNAFLQIAGQSLVLRNREDQGSIVPTKPKRI